MFDKKAAEQKYAHDVYYSRLVDSLRSAFSASAMTPGDAFSAVELACRLAHEDHLKELERAKA